MAYVSVILFLMSIGFMSPVDFKKWPCRPVEFKRQAVSPPSDWAVQEKGRWTCVCVCVVVVGGGGVMEVLTD